MEASSSAWSAPGDGVNDGHDDLDAARNKPIDCQMEDSAEVGMSEASNGRNEADTISSSPLVSSMSLNDNKAGMEGLDKERINKIIHETSKGSKFYENERRKDEVLKLKIKQQRTLAESITPGQLQLGFRQADQLLRNLEERRDLSRTIVHVDMDAFYAAVEMRDDPSLRNKPMAVGSLSMLSTSNYIARRFGIRAAMPGFIGRKLCPELVIVPLNFDKYIAVSETVKHILAVYDPHFSPMSLDEAYLDFTEHLCVRIHSPLSSRTFVLRTECSTGSSSLCMCDLNLVLRPLLLQEVSLSDNKMELVENVVDINQLFSHCIQTEHLKVCSLCKKPFPPFTLKVYDVNAEEAVLEMRNRIEQRTHLTASAGIAPNTMLAKICSDKNKPNGQFLIEPIKEQVQQFISGLPVRKIPGIGKVTEKLLEALGVITCQDLYQQRALLYHVFLSTSFHYFMNIALGIGSSTLEKNSERKSISTEHTFGELAQPRDLLKKCQELCQFLARDLKKERFLGKTVTLKIKTVSFEVKTRAHTLSHYSSDEKTIFTVAKQLLDTEIENMQPECLRLRLMGVRMSKLVSETNCSASVASFFERQGRTNSTWKNATVACPSVVINTHDSSESRDATASSSSLSSSMPFKDCCYLQQDYDDDDDECTDFQECIDNNNMQEMPNVNTASTGTKVIKNCPAQLHSKNNKIDKQETIVHFLFSKQNSPKVGENNSNCGQCMVKKSLCVSDVMGDDGSANKTCVGINNVSETPVAIKNVHNTFVSGVSAVDTRSNCPDLANSAMGTHMVSGIITGNHHQSPTLSLVPSGAQKLEPLNSGAVESSHTSGMIHCPVCGQQKYQWPLDQLNAHVDLCLSRSTVREILTDQQESQQGVLLRKRPRSTQMTDSQFDKRTKTQHTLLSFFKP